MVDCKYVIDRANLFSVRKQASEYLCEIDARVTTIELSPDGGIALYYLYDIELTGDPLTGHAAANTLDPTTVTELRLSEETAGGNDATIILADINVGDIVAYFEDNPPNNTSYYEVTAASVDSGTYFTVSVVWLSSVGAALPSVDDAPMTLHIIQKAIRYHDDLLDVTPDQHHEQIHKLYGDDAKGFNQHDDVLDNGLPILRDGLYWNGTAWQRDRRTRAVGDYVQGVEYQRGDELYNGDDLSECLIDGTTSSPYVAPTGEPAYLYTGTGMANNAQLASQIIFGNRYSNPTQAMYISGYRVNVVAGNSYSIVAVEDPLGIPVLDELLTFTASVTDWVEFAMNPRAVPVGTVFDLVCTVREPDPTPVIVTALYNYLTPQNAVNPLAGEIQHGRSQMDQMRISYTDDSAVPVDRTALIQGLSIGDQVSDGIIDWAVQSNSDQGTFAIIGVAPANVSTAGIKNFDFETVTPTPISVPSDPAYWATSTSPQVQGLIAVDVSYPNISTNTNAYGVDILIQAAYIPDLTEWRLKVIASSGGGGGGDFVPTTFAGAGTTGYVPDPITEQNFYLKDDGTFADPTGGTGAGYWTLNGDDIYNNNSGNVGIANTAPTSKLDIQGSNITTDNPLIRLRQFDSVGGQETRYSEIGVATSGNNGNSLFFNAKGGLDGEGLANASMQFQIENDEKMRISADGNVGINTDNPTARLDVDSPDFTTAQFRRDGTVGLQVQADNTGSGYIWSPASLYLSATHDNVLYAGNVERARILSTGKFLVGRTTQQHGTPTFDTTGSMNATQGIYVQDTRAWATPPPNPSEPSDYPTDTSALFLFENTIATGRTWDSTITVQGWTGSYDKWQLIGPSNNLSDPSSDLANKWFLRVGNNTNGWGALNEVVHSGNIDTLGHWTASGDDIYNNNTGNVGIGLTVPVAKLTVSTDGTTAYMSGSAQNRMLFTSDTKFATRLSNSDWQYTAYPEDLTIENQAQAGGGEGTFASLCLVAGYRNTARSGVVTARIASVRDDDAGTSGHLAFMTRGTGSYHKMSLGSNGGLTIAPEVTGGDMGRGTINVSGGYYVNGVPIGGGVDLDFTRDSTTVTVTNTGGTDAVLPSATSTLAGVQTAANYNAVSTAYNHSLSTSNPHDVSLAQLGFTGDSNATKSDLSRVTQYAAVIISNSGGTDASIQRATSSVAGIFGAQDYDALYALQAKTMNPDKIPPASSTDAGAKGDTAFDDNYIYVCVQDNVWKRTALSTW